MEAVVKTNIDSLELLHKGKVRDIYKYEENKLLIIATDRISAFDSVFPTPIPGKGIVLTQISNIWFKKMDFIDNHIVESDFDAFPENLKKYESQLRDRAVIVKKAERVDFEAVVRGYLAGSGWKEYQETSAVCGKTLPEGLQLAEKLEMPIFTPATKVDEGHDENVAFSYMVTELGKDIAEEIRHKSIQLFEKAGQLLDKKDIILADTKFEFGIVDGKVILIDELFTPDSSRFWFKPEYKIGESPQSFDKQFLRDYLERTKWNKLPPAPEIPENIVEKIVSRYKQIHEIITSI